MGEGHGKLRLLSWLFCSVGGEAWGACGQQRHLESSDLASQREDSGSGGAGFR